MSSTYPNRREAALDAVHRGFRPFPLRPVLGWPLRCECSCSKGARCPSIGKHPDCNWREQQCTTWRDVFRQWSPSSLRGIGVPLGQCRDRAIGVVDVDPRNGGSLELLEREGVYKPTFTVKTGGGGWHLYYWLDEPLPSFGAIYEGVDWKCDGGFVVWPGSPHRSGSEYTIHQGARSRILKAHPKLVRHLAAREPKPDPADYSPREWNGEIPDRIGHRLATDTRLNALWRGDTRHFPNAHDPSPSGAEFLLALLLLGDGESPQDVEDALRARRALARSVRPDSYYRNTVASALAVVDRTPIDVEAIKSLPTLGGR